MIRRLTILLALFFCVSTVGTQAQQKIELSTLPNIPKAMPLPNDATGGKYMSFNPYKDLPSKLLLGDTTLYVLFNMAADRIDSISQDTIIGKDTIPIVITFAPTTVTSGPTDTSYTIVGFSQFMEPLSGSFAIDSIALFIFRLRGENGVPIKKDVYLFPVHLPDNANISTYNVSFNKLKIDNDNPYYLIKKDSLNSPARYTGGSIWRLNIPTPKLTVPKNSKFGFVIATGTWIENQEKTDVIGVISTHDLTVPVNQTYGGIMRRSPKSTDDTVQNVYGANLRFGSGPRVKQNLVINMWGTYSGAWPITSVRPEPGYEAAGVTLGTSYPNPASQEAHIPFSIEKAAPVTLRLTNTLGQVIQKATFDDRGFGSYVWDVNTAELPNGTYFYTLTTGAKTITRTLQVNR